MDDNAWLVQALAGAYMQQGLAAEADYLLEHETLFEDAAMIVSSLTIIEAEGDADKTTSAANYDYTGWQSYANETLGYSLMYPGQADVMGADRDKSVEFVGPIVGDDHWPWFSIQHFDSEFFRPPVDANRHNP